MTTVRNKQKYAGENGFIHSPSKTTFSAHNKANPSLPKGKRLFRFGEHSSFLYPRATTAATWYRLGILKVSRSASSEKPFMMALFSPALSASRQMFSIRKAACCWLHDCISIRAVKGRNQRMTMPTRLYTHPKSTFVRVFSVYLMEAIENRPSKLATVDGNGSGLLSPVFLVCELSKVGNTLLRICVSERFESYPYRNTR